MNRVGPLLRDWRRRRRLSQLALAAETEVSQRHLSFIESGRAAPSRGMVLRLAERLAVPLRERNALLAAAGFAAVYPEQAPAEAGAVRDLVEAVLRAHAPHPALAVDRHWTLVAANHALAPLLAGIAPTLLAPPVNVLRLSLHPDGLAPRIRNFRDWRAHVLARLAREVELTGDDRLAGLARELAAYPVPPGARPPRRAAPEASIAMPLELDHPAGPLAFLTTTTVFGTALDVTLAELAIETLLPADTATAERMRALAAAAPGPA